MRLSRTSLQKAVTGVALGTGLAVASSANAGIVFDVRFTDGTNTKAISATGTYRLLVWARVTGTNANTADDAITSGYMNLRSQQISGGAMTGAGDGVKNRETPYGVTTNKKQAGF